jgi:ribosomal protein S18 acetylase RimI-like enzyme
MELSFAIATEDDTPAVAALRRAVAADLTRRYGHGHWSATATDASVQRDISTARVVLARAGSRDVATLRLAAKKPWAIDPAYFTDRKHVLYLTDMAVLPELQGQGIGRRCIGEACRIARAWPADVIRLDAYDGEVGAGAFYEKCGFRERGRITYRRTPLIYYELLL